MFSSRSKPNSFHDKQTGVGHNDDGEGICEAKTIGLRCNLKPDHKGYHHDWFKGEWWI